MYQAGIFFFRLGISTAVSTVSGSVALEEGEAPDDLEVNEEVGGDGGGVAAGRVATAEGGRSTVPSSHLVCLPPFLYSGLSSFIVYLQILRPPKESVNNAHCGLPLGPKLFPPPSK